MSDIGNTEGHVHDKEIAQKAAHTEKPIRDALIRSRDKLTPTQQVGADIMANDAGNDAIKAYRESTPPEDSRLAVLKNEVKKLFNTGSVTRGIESYDTAARSFIQEQAVAAGEQALRDMTDALGADGDWSSVRYELETAALRYNRALEHPARGMDQITDTAIKTAQGEPLRLAVLKTERLAHLTGWLAQRPDNHGPTMDILSDLSQLTGQPLAQVVEDQAGLLASGRALHPEPLDRTFMNSGFAWNEGAGSYFSMATPPSTPTPGTTPTG